MLYQGNALHEERHFVRMRGADYPAKDLAWDSLDDGRELLVHLWHD